MKKRKINKNRFCLFIVIILFGILLLISSIKIINYLKDNKENKEIQKRQEKLIEIIEPSIENGEQEVSYNIDFSSLKSQNSDTIAYLKVNGTNIDYIVVKGYDNSYYLNHNFNRNWNVSGWIFSDYHNKFDGTDKNIVIYGHNTYDGSMFGTLKNVLSSEWQNDENNLKIVLVTESGTYYYQVFSTYNITAEDYYINTKFDSGEDYLQFLETIKDRSNHNYKVDVGLDDNILTLSTCNSTGAKRVVLHAKMIK